MAEQLGKIEKPEAKEFTGRRKLYLSPLLFFAKDSPPEYVGKVKLYWEQVSSHIANLEAKAGKVNHVYHESITRGGEEGFNLMEKLNASSCRIAREKCQSGAVLEVVEDNELVEESIDWERFLIMGFISQKVAKVVSELYMEVSRKRYEHIARKIDETLGDDEVGLLFIREGHMVQFPPGIEVFSVSPPVLDEIHRWQREQLATGKKKEKPEE